MGQNVTAIWHMHTVAMCEYISTVQYLFPVGDKKTTSSGPHCRFYLSLYNAGGEQGSIALNYSSIISKSKGSEPSSCCGMLI